MHPNPTPNPPGLRRGHRGARHARRGELQGLHPHHAAAPRQPHALDLGRQRVGDGLYVRRAAGGGVRGGLGQASRILFCLRWGAGVKRPCLHHTKFYRVSLACVCLQPTVANVLLQLELPVPPRSCVPARTSRRGVSRPSGAEGVRAQLRAAQLKHLERLNAEDARRPTSAIPRHVRGHAAR